LRGKGHLLRLSGREESGRRRIVKGRPKGTGILDYVFGRTVAWLSASNMAVSMQIGRRALCRHQSGIPVALTGKDPNDRTEIND